jgi:ketosteroid isomerase-like protein
MLVLKAMNANLPQPIVDYFQAANAHHTVGVVAAFTDDALVTDENREYRGAAAVQGWSERVIKDYKPHAEAIEVAESGDQAVVTARVSGTFPGSPVQLRYRFTLKADKIAALRIEA